MRGGCRSCEEKGMWRERGGERMKTPKCYILNNIVGLLDHYHGMADLLEVQSPSAARGGRMEKMRSGSLWVTA